MHRVENLTLVFFLSNEKPDHLCELVLNEAQGGMLAISYGTNTESCMDGEISDQKDFHSKILSHYYL